MKRHPALQDFSRDHFMVLNVLLRLRRGEDAAMPAWLADHFAEEETLLSPYLPDALRARWLEDHAVLRGVLERGDPEELQVEFERHTRWEEHAIFGWLQTHCSAEELDAIGVASEAHRRAVRPEGIGPDRVV